MTINSFCEMPMKQKTTALVENERISGIETIRLDKISAQVRVFFHSAIKYQYQRKKIYPVLHRNL